MGTPRKAFFVVGPPTAGKTTMVTAMAGAFVDADELPHFKEVWPTMEAEHGKDWPDKMGKSTLISMEYSGRIIAALCIDIDLWVNSSALMGADLVAALYLRDWGMPDLDLKVIGFVPPLSELYRNAASRRMQPYGYKPSDEQVAQMARWYTDTLRSAGCPVYANRRDLFFALDIMPPQAAS